MSMRASGTETVIRPKEGTGEPTEYMVVRRRRGRRRRRDLLADGPQQRFRLGLLVVVVVLIIATLAGNSARHGISNALHRVTGLVPSSFLKSMGRPELVVLVLAAAILVYLMVPGLDQKVARMLGGKHRHRR